MAKKVLRKEYLYNRIAKESGVPKKTVRLVMRALPNVIYTAMAKCERIQIATGILLEGSKNKPKKYYNTKTNTIEENTVFIRPRCLFNATTKKLIMEAYERYQKKLEEQQKEYEEKKARGYFAEDYDDYDDDDYDDYDDDEYSSIDDFDD